MTRAKSLDDKSQYITFDDETAARSDVRRTAFRCDFSHLPASYRPDPASTLRWLVGVELVVQICQKDVKKHQHTGYGAEDDDQRCFGHGDDDEG